MAAEARKKLQKQSIFHCLFLSFFDFVYVVFCLFVQPNTVEHIFTCNVLHETSMGMYVYINIYMVDVPRLYMGWLAKIDPR